MKLPAGNHPPEVVTNIIVKSDDSALAWVQSTTERFGDWRAECRSTYIRWALCLNGLDLAAKSYASRAEEVERAFVVQSLRPDEAGDPALLNVAQWSFATASENHRLCVPMVCAFGLIDLFACLEELVFDAYMIWHESHPTECLVKGDENRALRRLFRAKTESAEAASAWEEAWTTRKLEWRRNRAYDGLEKVLLAYCGHAKLKKPTHYISGPTEWSESLGVVAHVRNMLVHGATHADQKLADMGKLPHCVGFRFNLGDPLELNLGHLMNVEHFADSLLTALNLSFADTYLPTKGDKAK